MIIGEAMIGNASISKGKQKLPVFKHIIDTREICEEGSSTSTQTLVSDEKILKIPRNQLFLTSSAAMSIGHCEDLFTQILLHLPPKSLLRFQCVSKQWCSIISGSDFRHLHGRKYHTYCLSPDSDALILFRHRNFELNFVSFSVDNIKLMYSITTQLRSFLFGEILNLHSCNGLLCIDFLLDHDLREYIVCNPTTRQYRLIPKCNSFVERYAFPSAVNISFDPLMSDHYKLVCLCVDVEDDAYNFFVYSSETGIWKDTEVSVEITNESFYFGNGILWNGNLHWLSKWRSILCFDLNKESLNWSVPSLSMLGQGTDCWYFGESGGCLCAIMLKPSQPMLFYVFEMKRDYSAWFLKASIDLNPLSLSYPSMLAAEYYPRFHFPHFLWCNNGKRGKLVISIAGKVILYDINDKTVMELVDVEPVHPCYSWRDMYNWYQTFTFTATLACV